MRPVPYCTFYTFLYMENRLASRITFCEFDKQIAGPIHDQQGFEQGGVSSSDGYKLYNNESLDTAQRSNLGVELGPSLVLSAVGQADDTVLLATAFKSSTLSYNLSKTTALNSVFNSARAKLSSSEFPLQDFKYLMPTTP